MKASPPAAASPLDRPTWQTIRDLLPYLWPKGETGARVRVVLATACLVLAKLANVYVPIVYSQAVDMLGKAPAMIVIPVGLIGGYGLLRVASSAFGELRDAIFASVQQGVVRKAGMQSFRHMHRLSLRFHLDRQTGGLSRHGGH